LGGKGVRTTNEFFRKASHAVAEAVGSPWAFVVALGIILAWAATGPLFDFSDTWQLVINTGTTIITFLMVFLIQNTQNSDAKAMHLKLDELIRGVEGARNRLVDLEQLTDEELDALQEQFERIRERAAKGRDVTPELNELAGEVEAVKEQSEVETQGPAEDRRPAA